MKHYTREHLVFHQRNAAPSTGGPRSHTDAPHKIWVSFMKHYTPTIQCVKENNPDFKSLRGKTMIYIRSRCDRTVSRPDLNVSRRVSKPFYCIGNVWFGSWRLDHWAASNWTRVYFKSYSRSSRT